MKKFIMAMCLLGLVGVFDLLIPAESEARRSSGGFKSSRSSSSSSSTRSRSKKSTFKKSTPAQKAAAKKKSAAQQKQRQAKAQATAKKKVEAKKAKALGNKDKAAFSKYKSKAGAETAYRNSLPKNKYTSKTAPATRPSHIPKTTSVGGKNVNVTYNVMPGGGYGYGYYGSGGSFMPMLATMYMVNSMSMRNAGYGNWNAAGQPIYPPRSGPSAGMIILSLFLVGFLVVGGVAMVRS